MRFIARQLIILCLAVLGIAINIAPAGAANVREINVSYVKSPFNAQIMAMKAMGMLEEEFAADNIAINWHSINSGAKQSEAMAAGSLDIASVINSTSVLLTNANGNPVKIIGGVSRPARTFAIVAGPNGPATVADLKGKTVAGPKGTVLHQLLVAALTREGLKESDVKFVSMDLPKARTAMLGGSVDAALLAAGLVINSVKAGARVLCTAEGLVVPKLVSAASDTFTREHPDLVARYAKVFRQATAWILANKDKAVEIGIAEHGISKEDGETLFDWAGFTDHLTAADILSMREDMGFLHDNGMIKNTMDPSSFCLPMSFME